ncbi:hypothetical protein H0H87_003263 [Tephrocybe sp. NHM501043]|nr:hypothetical protein H0H87_003263 [Tephrocybe sp. NHM501043]
MLENVRRRLTGHLFSAIRVHLVRPSVFEARDGLINFIRSNTVFFNLWRACSFASGALSPGYEEWIGKCQDSSVEVVDDYPSKWADTVTVTVIRANKSTFIVDTAIRGERYPVDYFPLLNELCIAETSGPNWITRAVAPIAGVLGFFVIASVLVYLYWIKKGQREETFASFVRRSLSRKAQKVRHAARDSHFEIDSPPGVTYDLEGAGTGNGYSSVHSRNSFVDTLKTVEPEYQFPFRKPWRNSQVAQQFRRLPGRLPFPFIDRAIQVRASKPGVRFRVDPSGSSTESSGSNPRSNTVEGGVPDTIEEVDDYPDTEYCNSLNGNEETSLISPIDRLENDVFLISNRGPSFTISSHSSHQVQIVPPTPTESSHHSQGHLVVAPSQVQPRHPPAIPPPPRGPPPIPPGPSVPRIDHLHGPRLPSHAEASRTHTTFDKNAPHQIQTDLPIVTHASSNPRLQPVAQAGPNRRYSPPPPGLPEQPTTSSRLPSEGISNQYPRHKASVDEDDRSKHVPRRPMGARLPSSPFHIAHQRSLDDELSKYSPLIHSGDYVYMPSSPPPPQATTPSHQAHHPYVHQRAYSDDMVPPALPPPRPVHNRNLSSESLIPTSGDKRMLYPGPVRAVGCNLPADGN